MRPGSLGGKRQGGEDKDRGRRKGWDRAWQGWGGQGQFGEAFVPQLSEQVRKSPRCWLLLGRGGHFTPEASTKGNSWD